MKRTELKTDGTIYAYKERFGTLQRVIVVDAEKVHRVGKSEYENRDGIKIATVDGEPLYVRRIKREDYLNAKKVLEIVKECEESGESVSEATRKAGIYMTAHYARRVIAQYDGEQVFTIDGKKVKRQVYRVRPQTVISTWEAHEAEKVAEQDRRNARKAKAADRAAKMSAKVDRLPEGLQKFFPINWHEGSEYATWGSVSAHQMEDLLDEMLKYEGIDQTQYGKETAA